MPAIHAEIIKAWRFTNEMGRKVGRIHYTIRKVSGDLRHGKVDEGDALYEVLDEYLRAQGYTGPQEGEEDVA